MRNPIPPRDSRDHRNLPGTSSDFVITHDFYPKIGGAHHWLYEVYRRWPTPVTVLTVSNAREPEAEHSENEFDGSNRTALRIVRCLSPIGNLDLLSFGCLIELKRQARAIDRDIAGRRCMIHCLRAFPEGLLGLLVRVQNPWRSDLVTYAHGEDVLIATSSRQLALIARQVYARSDLVIANSRSTRDLVLELCPRANVVCVHPGVAACDYRVAARDIAAYRSSLRWPEETVVLSTVARMELRKNQASVIQAVAALRRLGLPLAYVCAGAGDEQARLASLAETLNVPEWVRFPGCVSESEKRLIFAASDIHVMPSIRTGQLIEGFGIVFLEAAAAGTPSICGNVGGQAEAVINCVTGVVVDGTKQVELNSAIAQFAKNHEWRARLGRHCLRWAAAHDWARVVQRTLRHVAALGAQPRGSAGLPVPQKRGTNVRPSRSTFDHSIRAALHDRSQGVGEKCRTS
jgi:phosphatidyl-myo-inositol dimannoside synthase